MAAKRISSFKEVDGLASGTKVFATFLPNSEASETLSICQRLVQDGLCPIAHVPARTLGSLSAVDSFLGDLSSVGVREALVIAGGVDNPTGELRDSLQILESGLLQKHKFTRVGVAAHPEGHPDVPAEVVEDFLVRKVRWSEEANVELFLATQFCFDPQPVLEWERRIRERLAQEGLQGPPILVGVAGPARMSNLIKFAAMAGVGPSIRMLTKYTGNLIALATTATPHELIFGLAEKEPENLIQGLHLYAFGGLAKNVQWMNQVVDGKIQLQSAGFQVA